VEAAQILMSRAADVVLGPALDGGYYLIGAHQPHAGLFSDIPWSTPEVFDLTQARAAALGLTVRLLPPWYDVDCAASLVMLIQHLSGAALPSSSRISLAPGPAAAVRHLLKNTAALQELATTACKTPPAQVLHQRK
jgi:hypothetical protein